MSHYLVSHTRTKRVCLILRVSISFSLLWGKLFTFRCLATNTIDYLLTYLTHSSFLTRVDKIYKYLRQKKRKKKVYIYCVYPVPCLFFLSSLPCLTTKILRVGRYNACLPIYLHTRTYIHTLWLGEYRTVPTLRRALSDSRIGEIPASHLSLVLSWHQRKNKTLLRVHASLPTCTHLGSR
ncbi:hypothetical protein GGS20DRAFT_541682 [Poronia punctata]|nr:hypothetical protein GGS20DRAFT_541682 [Poronia punctata]